MTHHGSSTGPGAESACSSDLVDGHADDVDEANLHSRQFGGPLAVHHVDRLHVQLVSLDVALLEKLARYQLGHLPNKVRGVRRTSSQTDRNLRGPRVARQKQTSIDRHRLPAPDPQQQTRRPPLLLSIDGTDRRTDGHSTVL